MNFSTFIVYMLDALEGFFSKPKMLKVFKVSIRSTTPIWLCLLYSTQNSKTQSPNFLIQICIWFHMWYLLKFLNSFFTIFKIQIENINSLWTLRNSCKFLQWCQVDDMTMILLKVSKPMCVSISMVSGPI